MMDQGDTSAVPPELLPPGVHPVWSPHDAFEAAALMEALTVDQARAARTADKSSD